MKKRFLFPAFIFFTLFFPGRAWAEDPLLKVEASADQNSAKVGMMFLVHVRVVNTSTDASTGFWANSCSYEKHWVSDRDEVRLQSWTCRENVLEEVSLDAGRAYEKDMILYISEKEKTGPVTFRMGFKRMSENGEVFEPLWSGPVTMNIVVPETEADSAGSSDDPERAATSGEGAPDDEGLSNGETGEAAKEKPADTESDIDAKLAKKIPS